MEAVEPGGAGKQLAGNDLVVRTGWYGKDWRWIHSSRPRTDDRKAVNFRNDSWRRLALPSFPTDV